MFIQQPLSCNCEERSVHSRMAARQGKRGRTVLKVFHIIKLVRSQAWFKHCLFFGGSSISGPWNVQSGSDDSASSCLLGQRGGGGGG